MVALLRSVVLIGLVGATVADGLKARGRRQTIERAHEAHFRNLRAGRRTQLDWVGAKQGSTELVDRIAKALKPTATPQDCDGFYDEGHGGAFYRWCLNVLNQAVRRKPEEGLLGLSYGIYTWDSWSRLLANDFGVDTVLHDCYSTAPFQGVHAQYDVPYVRKDICISGDGKPRDGHVFEAFNTHIEPRPPRGTLMKMDIEGSEWAALKNATDEQLKKIDLLDMEIHFCHLIGNVVGLQDKKYSDEEVLAVLKDRVEMVERLSNLFYIVGKDPVDAGDPHPGYKQMQLAFQGLAKYSNFTDLDICRGKDYPQKNAYGMISISLVNKERLAEAQRGPRLVRQGPAKLHKSQSFVDP